MKRKYIYSLSVSLAAILALNSCAEFQAALAEAQRKQQSPEAQRQQQALTPPKISNDPIEAYLQYLDIFNLVCDQLAAGNITTAKAISTLQKFSRGVAELDEAYAARGVDLLGALYSPKYNHQFQAIVNRASSNIRLFGVDLTTDPGNRNNALQNAIGCGFSAMNHSG